MEDWKGGRGQIQVITTPNDETEQLQGGMAWKIGRMAD